MKKIFPFIFALLTLSTSLSLTAQPRRPGSPAVPSAAKVEITSEPDPLNDFAKKGLP